MVRYQQRRSNKRFTYATKGYMPMVPASFVNFFVATASASAALVGLLFVATAVAPDRIFRTATFHYAIATSALTTLINILFVSLSALIPFISIGWLALGASLLCLLNTLGLAYTLLYQELNRVLARRRIVLMTASFIIFGIQAWHAAQLVVTPSDHVALVGLALTLLASFGVGILRSWELLGARNLRFRDWLGPRRFTEEHMLVPHSALTTPDNA
jgi:hypothetical protein